LRVINLFLNNPEIEGLCGMCEMRVGDKDKGCFASHASVATASRGEVTIGDLRVGDEVRAAVDGVVVWTHVVFTLDHTQPVATLELFVDNAREGGGRERRIELTAPHLIDVLERGWGKRYQSKLVAARDIKMGDGAGRRGRGNCLLYCCRMGRDDALSCLDRVLPGAFGKRGVKAALMAVLESPLLHVSEKLVNSVSSVSAPLLVRTSEFARRLVVPVGVSTV